MSRMFCCNRHNPECTARKCKGDNTATRPMWGAAAVEICNGGKRQKTNKVECLWQEITRVREDWDYTLSGLARISLEGKDAIRAAVVELEKAGYVTRSRVRNEKGHLLGTEYIIREQPVFSPEPALEEPASENPTLEDTTQL